jgi:uncharacterized protein
VDADPVEIRVLGCLIEKQRTTPDAYPLSLNALRLACNQATNRDPVVEYDETTIRPALDSLARRGWARLASGPGSRAAKFRHLFDEALGLGEAEISLLAVLMLRGPQTLGELKQRSERLWRFAGLDEIESVLSALAERELVTRLPRRPGQKEERYAQLLGDEPAAELPSGDEAPTFAAPAGDRLAALEDAVAELRQDVAALRSEFASVRGQTEREDAAS